LENERVKIVREFLRVAKKDAPIFASVISRAGVLKTIFLLVQYETRYTEKHWETGNYIPGVDDEGFTAVHWFLPEELETLFEGQDVKVLKIAGLEGLSPQNMRIVNKLSKDQEKMEHLAKSSTNDLYASSSCRQRRAFSLRGQTCWSGGQRK
jgi:hypothetical protein